MLDFSVIRITIVLSFCFGLVWQAMSTESYFSFSSKKPSQNCPVLYLLNVLPYPANSVISGWDKGLDLIPGGHLAAEQINNRSDILSGHRLQIIDIDSEDCDSRTLTKGLVNFYRELVFSNDNMCIVGVMGLVCSSTTNVIARIAGHSNVGYIQMALSVSPQLRNMLEFPYLFHTISSSSVFNKAVIAMMKAFDWQRIGLVHDALGLYSLSTANDFVQQIKESYHHADTVTRVQISNTHTAIPEIFRLINDQEVRISYWVVSHDQGASSLCEAYKRNFLWPGYAYIMRLLDQNGVLKSGEKTSCTRDEIELALEGVFLLEYRFFVSDDTVLYSGWTYGEFGRRYRERLYAEDRSDRVEEKIFASSLYDQVWAYALAINNSLTSIASQNLSFMDYRIGNTKPISKILKSELRKLSFQGASGRIEFGEEQEVPSFIDIFQIQQQTRVLIGIYDPFTTNVTFTDHVSSDFPGDTFETVYVLFPPWLGGCMLAAQAILFCTISVNMILLLYWRRKQEIKASSPILSMLMIVGCYLLCVASVLLIVKKLLK